MKKVLVTGGTGFIGEWLVNELINHDCEVTLLIRHGGLSQIKRKNVTSVICDYNRLNEVELGEKKYDIFYHLAWAGVSSEKKNQIDLQLSNIRYAVNAMLLAKKYECEKFIATGTVAEYVFCESVMNVNEKQTPNDIYGAVKTSIHYILDVLSRQIGQPFIWAVLPSTFGEGRRDSNILTYTIKTLLQREKPVYGNLEQLWDFLYVSEVVKALRLIGEKGICGKTYGIGSGNFRPLKEYIIKIRDIIDPDLPLGIGERPELSDRALSSCVNIFDLVKDVGFKPCVSFETGIERMIEYMREESLEK